MWFTPSSNTHAKVSLHRGCDLNTVQIIGVCLIAAGALYFAGLFAYGKYKNRVVKVDSVTKSSDAPAPKGITEYVDLVEAASPNATADIRLGYVSLGYTEAEVLRSEVARLGKVQT